MTRQGVVFLLVAASSILSQQPASKPAPPVEMTAHLLDGSSIRKVVLQQSVELVTKHGTLTVPVADIRRIEFGLRLSKDETAEIDRAVAQLASDKVAEREGASKKLIAMSFRAYLAVKTAARSKDKNVAAQATAALEQIRATTAADLLRPHDHDVIHTSVSVLSGKIKETVFRAKTAAFGDIPLKITDLVSLQASLPTTAVNVGAGTFEKGVHWYDTGIQIAADTRVVISASGEIDLQTENGGPRVISGPDGCVTAAGPVHLAGTLVGKIGDQKCYFVIGDHFEGEFKQGGRLYLWVVPFQKDGKSNGTYRVSVAVDRLTGNVRKFEATKRDPRVLEAALESKRKKRDQLSKEIIAWTKFMRDNPEKFSRESPQFDGQLHGAYTRGISKNMDDLRCLEKVLRDEIGLHPAEWLEKAAQSVGGWSLQGGVAPVRALDFGFPVVRPNGDRE